MDDLGLTIREAVGATATSEVLIKAKRAFSAFCFCSLAPLSQTGSGRLDDSANGEALIEVKRRVRYSRPLAQLIAGRREPPC